MRSFLRSAHLFVAFTLTLTAVSLEAQIAEPNVNMVAGTQYPTGDPFLQRQNEPSGAVSTRNPAHLLVGANDYRTVDLPGLQDRVIGDAWLGIFKSTDQGRTWFSTLLPGYPQDTSVEGMAAPIKGFDAGADPVMRAGPNGMFFFAGIALNRGTNPLSAIFLARFNDLNNRESGDPFRYLDMNVLARGTSGEFVDKPWLFVDRPVTNAAPCTVGLQSFPAFNVYLAWTAILGDTQNPHTKLMFMSSNNCGKSWNQPIKLSESNSVNQGATFAVDPNTGSIYVIWRRFRSNTDTDAILVAKSMDGGKAFTKAAEVRTITPFEQGTTATSIRSSAYPTAACDASGRLYVAWAERSGPSGDGRVVVTTSSDGLSWSEPFMAAPFAGRGHQLMPALSLASGKLVLIYYDLREDHTIARYTPVIGSGGLFNEERTPAGDLATSPPKPEKVFTSFLMDAAPVAMGPLLRRHTIDVRASQATVGALPIFAPSQRVSRYRFGSSGATTSITQLQFNPPGLPLFKLGTVPFLGDYIDIAALSFVPAGGSWNFNTQPSGALVSHAFWTDNRDVRPPRDGNWARYTPVGVHGASIFDPTQQVPPCVEGQTGMRNQNIYTSRITDGLVVASPGNAKQLGAFQRAFVVIVQNTKNVTQTYRLTIANQPPGGKASFLQIPTDSPAVLSLDVRVNARSSASRPVFVQSSDPHARITVNVAETSAVGGAELPQGLTANTILNPDIANPDIANPDIANPDIANPDIANAEVYNPDIANPDIANPDIANPDIANPDIANPDIANPDIANPDIANPDIANPDIANPDIANPDIANPDIANPDIANPDIANGSMTDTTWQVTNRGNTTASYTIKLLPKQAISAALKMQLILHSTYQTPVARKCVLGTERQENILANIPAPALATIDNVTNPDLADPAAPTLSLAPGASAKITVRIVDPTRRQVTIDASSLITPVAVAHAVNTADLNNSNPRPSLTLVIVTSALPEGITGSPYAASIKALGGIGSLTWSVAAGSALPPGVSLNALSGALSGTPTVPGTYVFKIAVTAGSDPDAATQTFTTSFYDPVVILTASLSDALVSTSYSVQLAARGGHTPILWSTTSPLPAGLSLSADGLINGLPTVPGTYPLTVRASDSGNPAQSATANLTLNVVRPLLITTPAALPDARTSVPYSTSLTGAGGVAPILWSITSGALPAGLSLSQSGVVSGTTTAVGSFAFTLLAADSGNPPQSVTAQMTMNVVQPLVVTTGSLPDAVQSAPYATSLTAVGGLVPYRWSISSGALPPGLSLNVNGSISGTTTTTGVFAFQVTLADSGNPLQATTANLTLNVVARLIILSSALPSATEGAPYSALLASSGGVAPVQWSIISGALPAGLSLSSSGVIAGSTVAVGVFPFQVRVADSGSPAQTATATVSLEVLAKPAPITSIIPGTAAAGYGQLIAVSTSSIPPPTTWSDKHFKVMFTQAGVAQPGSPIHSASSGNIVLVRLPFAGDGLGSTGLQPGLATVSIRYNGGESNGIPLTVSVKPGTPVIRLVMAASPNGSACGASVSSANPTEAIAAGKPIGVSAFGIDNVGAVVRFVQGRKPPIDVAASCGTDSSGFGQAAIVVVPATLQSGTPVTISIGTSVKGQASDFSGGVTLPVLTP